MQAMARALQLRFVKWLLSQKFKEELYVAERLEQPWGELIGSLLVAHYKSKTEKYKSLSHSVSIHRAAHFTSRSLSVSPLIKEEHAIVSKLVAR